MSDKNMLSPDWVTVLEGATVTCEDVTIKLSTSLPILEGCLTATCDKWANGKSISSIQVDTGRVSIRHGAKTDSDLARPPGGDHPARPSSKLARVSSLGARCDAGDRQRSVRARVPMTRSEARRGPRMRLEERAGGGPGPAGGGPGQEDRAWIQADDVYLGARGALTDRMTAETLPSRVRADIAYVTYTCICTALTMRKWY
jgi:hypothetical protein